MDMMSNQTMTPDLSDYEQAAQTGSVDAQVTLGLRYSTGHDGPVDRVMAHMWLNIAAFRGHEEAKRLRGELSREMTHDEVAEAQRRAREWLAHDA